MNSISNWAGQVTTGHGAMALAGTVLACLGGQMSWQAATPLLVAGLVGLLWPENAAPGGVTAQKIVADAQPLAVDIEAEVRRLLSRQFGKPPVPANAATSGMMSLRAALGLGLVAALALGWLATPPALWLTGAATLVVLLLGSIALRLACRRVSGALLGMTLLAGCTSAQVASNLQANGVSAPAAAKIGSVVSTAVDDGTLFCRFSNAIAAVPGVNVIGHDADAIKTACASATIIGAIANAMTPAMTPVPVPPPATPAAVPIAVVPPANAAAVAASVAVKS